MMDFNYYPPGKKSWNHEESLAKTVNYLLGTCQTWDTHNDCEREKEENN